MKRLVIVICILVCACDAAALDARKLVQEELVDGGSAIFEDVVSTTLDGQQLVCGWVNSRNRMGGYAGFQIFLVADGEVVILGDQRDPGTSASLGQCMAADEAAAQRLIRDVDRSLDAYDAAVKAEAR